MSHFTKVQTQIKDLQALRQACTEMGLELLEAKEGEKVNCRGYNTWGCDAVVRLKGRYDVGLNRTAEGFGAWVAGYEITADYWQGYVEKEVGKNCGLLLQRYGVVKAETEARKQGLSAFRRYLQGGTIQLTLQERSY